MSDTPDTTVEEETVEEAPVAEQDTTDDPGEDVGALKRAYERVKEKRQAAEEELRRIREDEDYDRESLLKQWGYEVAADDEADTSEEDDLDFEDDQPKELRDPRVDELLAERDQARLKADLDSFNEDSGWELDDDDRRRIEIDARLLGGEKGFGPDQLKKAHKAYIERLDRAVEARSEKPKKPKPPHVPKTGQAGTQVPDLDDRNERRRYIAERLQADT